MWEVTNADWKAVSAWCSSRLPDVCVCINDCSIQHTHRVTQLADILWDFKTSQHNYLILLFNREESAEFACTDYTQLAHKFHKKNK